MRPHWQALCVGIALTNPLSAQVVVPNEYAVAEAPSNNAAPFSSAVCGASGVRYQQIYAGGQVGQGAIQALRFRQDGFASGGSAVSFQGVTVRLSSTSRLIDDLSVQLNSNVGADATTVYQGALTLTPSASTATPRPFALAIPLTVPFAFDGSWGMNLLLEISITGCADLGYGLDYATNNAAVSRAFVADAQGLVATSRTSSVGLVTQFVFEQVAGSCAAGDTTLCIDQQPGDRRFEARVAYQTSQAGGRQGSGHAIPLASLGVARGGLFWFFGPDNPEMLLKVLDGCALNGHFWIFYSAGTNVGLTTTVRDTVTGSVWTRTNPDLRAAPPEQDTSALPCQ
jgi:hypothetical protein